MSSLLPNVSSQLGKGEMTQFVRVCVSVCVCLCDCGGAWGTSFQATAKTSFCQTVALKKVPHVFEHLRNASNFLSSLSRCRNTPSVCLLLQTQTLCSLLLRVRRLAAMVESSSLCCPGNQHWNPVGSSSGLSPDLNSERLLSSLCSQVLHVSCSALEGMKQTG